MKTLKIPAYLSRRIVGSLLGLTTSLVAAQNPPDLVGEVTLLIGQAQVIGTDDVVRTVERGLTVRTGDRIETQAGGHVHIRFVDGARVSVRPASRLQIESYSYSTQQSHGSAIKFRLDEGVIRSITGAWGEAARERFRLNTPMAAVGIKGTDFVVRSDANSTAASVYAGAIILAPLSDCGAAVGSCQNGSEKLLSADMKGIMLELTRQQGSPQFVTAVDLLASARRPSAGTGVATSTVQPGIGTGTPAVSGADVNKPLVNEARGIELVEAASQTATALARANQVAPALPQSPQVNQLVWARYAWVKDGGFDTLSKSFEQASAAGRESVAAGMSHALFRDPSPTAAVLATADTKVNFRLADSSALFQRFFDLGVEAAKVEKGTFLVDFSRSTFGTQLDVSSATMGAQNLVANGSIGKDGVMQSISANARILGGMTLDGKEAGYLFEKDFSNGALRGVTLWGR
ncbi:MAG: FecR domain-containing protein [Comamonadaceae bacterium]|nr:FecR domain-containing protein [Comamonadaceae bacterium]